MRLVSVNFARKGSAHLHFMIVRKLPQPNTALLRHQTGVCADHTLFTERIDRPYVYPDHVTGWGILSMLTGKGNYVVNGKKERLDNSSFLVINRGSRLSVDCQQRDAQPLLLFFHPGMAGREPADFPCSNVCISKIHRCRNAWNGWPGWVIAAPPSAP